MREMLIKIKNKEAFIAMTNDRQLIEVFLPRQDHQNLFGNIYLGKVENVLPGMQAAFINIGLEKNSFLYVEDALAPASINGQGKLPSADRTRPINELVKPGQQVMVQLFKEPAGTKGARVTMYPSLPGRFVVLLPMGDYIAVSRRIEAEEQREQLKELVRSELPEHMGAIIRTVAGSAPPQAILADLHRLIKEWHRIQGRAAKATSPALLYSDFDMLKRVIRDTNADDIDKIVVANAEDYEEVSDICESIAPGLRDALIIRESNDLFGDYDIYSQMERALHRKIWLKSGGYIIIDQTEALTAIDVNTGKYIGENDLASTVFKTNMEAVVEIARQLRLRNIGGIVIIDFIDMDDPEDKQKLLDELNERMKEDRVRITVMGMTQLGLVELTRKKVGHDLSSVIEKECPYCGGKGKTPVDIMEMLQKSRDS